MLQSYQKNNKHAKNLIQEEKNTIKLGKRKYNRKLFRSYMTEYCTTVHKKIININHLYFSIDFKILFIKKDKPHNSGAFYIIFSSRNLYSFDYIKKYDQYRNSYIHKYRINHETQLLTLVDFHLVCKNNKSYLVPRVLDKSLWYVLFKINE